MPIALEELTVLDLANYDPHKSPLEGSQIIVLEGDLTPEQHQQISERLFIVTVADFTI